MSPCREIRLELAEPVAAERLEVYGTVQQLEGRQVRLLVPRGNLTGQVARMLAELAVEDLEVKDPPIEDLIGQVFRQGEV